MCCLSYIRLLLDKFVLIKPKKKLSVVILAKKKANDFFELGELSQNLMETLEKLK